jgi:hypothetical protein
MMAIPVFAGDGDTTTIIGGHFTFDDQPHPFLKDSAAHHSY